MEDTEDTESGRIIYQVGQNMIKHSTLSSNLAALSLHVTRMLIQLVKDIQQITTTLPKENGKSSTSTTTTSDIFTRIALVGKARATAGALHLLRLLVHPLVAHKTNQSSGNVTSTSRELEAAFLYKTRGDLPQDQPAGRVLISAILDLIVVTGSEFCDALKIPEVYDTTTIGIQFLLVSCGTQLYQPFQSSFQETTTTENVEYEKENYFLDEILRDETDDERVVSKGMGQFSSTKRRSSQVSNRDVVSSSSSTSSSHLPKGRRVWTHQSILSTCLQWLVKRPTAPEHSISYYYSKMAQVAVSARGGETLGRDGMYESYLVVHAHAPRTNGSQNSTTESSADSTNGGGSNSSYHRIKHYRSSQSVILDATKGAFLLGTSIILLPFRLMTLVLGVITSNKNNRTGEDAQNLIRKMKSWKSSRTRDVLWLSDCILTDLMSSFVLLLVNNQRRQSNPFRKILRELSDRSWGKELDPTLGLPDLPHVESSTSEKTNGGTNNGSSSMNDGHSGEPSTAKDSTSVEGTTYLSVKLDALYEAFGRSLHTEVGALMLYTLYHASPSIAETMVVRSELDCLVLPLLRTLYFSSNIQAYAASDFASNTVGRHADVKFDIRNCPFRSLSQLYVVIILLLLFSQDTIFGRDAFRRIRVSHVPWYKERNLRNINLGSVVLLTLLRSLLFNLHRLEDSFLLSNCCAVLQNLSSSIVDVHDYTAMRLASVTVTVMKKHLKLSNSSTRQEPLKEDDPPTTSLTMYEEVALTLLEAIYKCLSSKTIERNLHLVYALVYHQADFNRVLKEKELYPMKLLQRIQSVTTEASKIIQDDGARSAAKALVVLEANVEDLQKVADDTKSRKERDDIAFTYEEEMDPETFFVPYVWETIVCAVTSGTIEWKKENIQAFTLLEPFDEESAQIPERNGVPEPDSGQFSDDVGDVV